MKHVAWFLCALAMLALESPALRAVERWWLAPDVLVLSSVYLASRGDFIKGLLTAAAIGLAKDGFCLAAPVGIFTEIGALGFLATRMLGGRVDLGSVMPTMATCGIGTFVASGLYLLFAVVFHRAFVASTEVVAAVPSMALGTMLLSPLIFGALDRVGGLFERRERLHTLMQRLR